VPTNNIIATAHPAEVADRNKWGLLAKSVVFARNVKLLILEFCF